MLAIRVIAAELSSTVAGARLLHAQTKERPSDPSELDFDPNMPRFRQFQKRRARFDPDKARRWVREPFLGKPGHTILASLPNRPPSERRRRQRLGLVDSYYTLPLSQPPPARLSDGGAAAALPESRRAALGPSARGLPLQLPQLVLDFDTNATLLFDADASCSGPKRLASIIQSARFQREVQALRPEFHVKFVRLLGEYSRPDRFASVDQLVVNLHHLSKVLGKARGGLRDQLYTFFFAHLASIQPTLLAHVDSDAVTDKDVGMILWAHANAGVQPEQRLHAAVCAAVTSRRVRLSAVGVASVFWSLGKLKLPPPTRLFNVLSSDFVALKEQFDAHGLANVLCSLGRLQTPPPPLMLKALVGRCVAASGQFTPQGIVDAVTAFARLGQRPPEPLARALSIVASEKAGRFPVAAMSQLFDAYASMNMRPHPRLAAMMAAAAIRKAHRWQPSEARQFLAAFRRFGIPVSPQLAHAFQPYTDRAKKLPNDVDLRLVAGIEQHPMLAGL